MGKKVGGTPLFLLVGAALLIAALVVKCDKDGPPPMLRFSQAPIEDTVKTG